MDNEKTFCDNPLHMSEFPRRRGSSFDIIVLDDRCTEILFRIERTIRRLSPIGDDEQRILWVELVRGDIEEWCPYRNFVPEYGRKSKKLWREEWLAYRPEPVTWTQIASSQIDDQHFISFSDRIWNVIHFGGNRSDHPNAVHEYVDYFPFFSKLETYVTALVDKILLNPDSYMDYVEKNLPFKHRYGKILRKTRDRFFPVYDIRNKLRNPSEAEAFVRRRASAPESGDYDHMTLRDYMHFWRIAYRAWLDPDKDEYNRELASKFDSEGYSDIDAFSHSSKGDWYVLKEYDIDSEEDFIRWEKENGYAHNMDVIYARVHLSARKEEDGKWHLILATVYENYAEDYISIGMALEHSGVGFRLQNAEDILRMFNGEDFIDVTPYHDWCYFNRPNMAFPSEFPDESTRENFNREVIWDKEPKISVLDSHQVPQSRNS